MYIFIGVIIWALIWGAVTRQCMVNKGYEEDADAWFIIGLFLGIFAFILAYCKPDIKKQQQEEMMRKQMMNMNQNIPNPPPAPPEKFEWKCSKCGEINRVNKNRCFKCGAERDTEIIYHGKNEEETQPADKTQDELQQYEIIKSELNIYKELLDSGLISEEDYIAKKKQLLGL